MGICQTPALFYCYWDKPIGLEGEDPYHTFCKHCSSEYGQAPEYCSDYHNETACDSDRCIVSGYGCPSGADCHCYWENNQCKQAVHRTGPNPNECCSCSITYGTCNQGCTGQQNSREKNIFCNNCLETPGTNCSTYGQQPIECIGCSFKQDRFPFFMPWQILIVLALLSAYYILIIFKKKKLVR